MFASAMGQDIFFPFFVGLRTIKQNDHKMFEQATTEYDPAESIVM